MQVSVNIIRGQSFLEALGNVDGTSVLASGMTGALGILGSSKSIKIGVGIINIADAVVDVKLNGKTEYIGGDSGHEKNWAKVGVDLVANTIPDYWTKGLSADLVNSAKSKVEGVGAKESEQSIKNTVTTMFKANGEGLKNYYRYEKRRTE